MARFGFCGATYQSQSLNVDAQECTNFFPESDESGWGKTAVALYPTPGTEIFCNLGGASIRGMIRISQPDSPTERVFAVSGSTFFEILNDTSTMIRNAGTPFGGTGMVSMAASPSQILIIANLTPYCFSLVTNSFEALKTYTTGAGAIAAPIGIVSPGTRYTVSDTVVPTGGGGTGGAFTVTSVTSAVTTTYGLISGLVLSNALGAVPTAPGLTGGDLEAQSTVITLSGAQSPGVPPVSPDGSGLVSYLFYNSTTAYYYSLNPTATTPGDCPIGSLQTSFNRISHQWQTTVLSQPAYGTTTITIDPGGAVTGISIATPGTLYTPQASSPVTGGTGTGLQVSFSTSSITAGSGMIANPVLCAFVDGFFIVLKQNSQEIQVSRLYDGSTWDPTDVAQVSVFVDNVVSMIADHRLLWLWGSKQTNPYYNNGQTFPFVPVEGGFMEQGSAAMLAPVRLDNSVMWIGEDERGARVAWRANGYTPQRISNHAVEYAWQGYSTISDAIGYPWQFSGHAFWQIYFPTAGKTWCYDAATGQWHQRTSWNATMGTWAAHASQCHVYAFSKHLVGDWASGNVYETGEGIWTDNANTIQRIRTSPYIFREHKWIRHHELELDVEVGLGPQPALTDGSGNPRQPQLVLQWSDDQGKTWSFGRVLDCGFAGEYLKRVRALQLGRSRGRIYRVTCTDPIAWRFADAYLRATPNFITSERLSAQIGKMG